MKIVSWNINSLRKRQERLLALAARDEPGCCLFAGNEMHRRTISRAETLRDAGYRGGVPRAEVI